MAGDSNLYDNLERAIAEARSTLPSSMDADADDVSTWSADDVAEVEQLQRDYGTVRGHRDVALGMTMADATSICSGCHEVRPCPAVRDLAGKYKVTGEGERSSSRYTTLTAAEKSLDNVGRCACGLYGEQRHQRVSGPGVNPEAWVRTSFHCLPTRPGPHYRLD